MGKAESSLDWDALARFPGTLVVYMGVTTAGNVDQSIDGRGQVTGYARGTDSAL